MSRGTYHIQRSQVKGPGRSRIAIATMRARAMNPIGVAVIGAGPWGETLARTFARVPGVDLRWICELDEHRRAEARAAHPTATITAVLDDVLADPAVMAAIVAVDAPRHHSVGLQVLSADRHLLVEKPLALSVADAAARARRRRSRGRVLTVGHLLLHHPAVQRAKQLLETGALGRPLYFEVARTVTAAEPPWRERLVDSRAARRLAGAASFRRPSGGGQRRRQPRRRRRGRRDVRDAAFRRRAVGPPARGPHVAAARERRFSVVGTERALSFDELAPNRRSV